MKIMFFTDTYEPQINGVVTSIKLLEKSLKKRGHEVFIVCPKDPIHSYPENVFPLRSLTFKPYPEYRAALPSLSLIEWFEKIDPDVVHVHSPAIVGLLGIKLGKKYDKPVIGTYHTMIEDFFNLYFVPSFLKKRKITKKVTKKFIKKFTKYFYNKFDMITVPSTPIMNFLKRIGVDKPIKVLPMGVDTKFFRPYEIRKREKVVLWVGRLSREKNIHILLKAFSIVEKKVDVKLIIASDGPDRKRLERIARKLKINVEFLGYVDDKELPKLYSVASVFVSPSRIETQGLTILEAFACGCPAIVANALGFRDFVIDGKNGFLIDSNKPGDYAEKILMILNDSKLRIRLSRHALKTAKAFSLTKQLKKFLNLYKKVL